jgi:WD40 repeat protein
MRQLRVCHASVRCLDYSPDGTWLATGDVCGIVGLWPLPGGEPAEPIGEHDNDSIEALAFHPAGRTIAVGTGRGEIALIDPASRNVFPRMKMHDDGVRSFAWSSDGSVLASSSWDGTVRRWTSTLVERVVHALPPPEVVHGLAFLPGGWTLAMVGSAGALELMHVSGTPRKRKALPGEYQQFAVAVSPDGKLVATGSVRGEIGLWGAPELDEVATLTGHDWTVYGLAFSPDGRTLVSGGADGTVRVWDVPARRLVETYRWHTSWVTCIAVSPDGMTAAAGSADGTAVLWDLDR